MVEDQIRAMKLLLVIHSADILNEYTVNRNGCSPYEETHGQNAPQKRVELGERVYYYSPKKGPSKT